MGRLTRPIKDGYSSDKPLKEVVFTAKVQSRGEDDRVSIEIPSRFRLIVKKWDHPWVKIMKSPPS